METRSTPNPRLTRRRATSLQVIAKEVGVSAMTVSRALNGRPDVSPETRRRIEEVAAALNYTPNRWARSLITNRSQVIGVVVPDIAADFYGTVTRGIQQALEPNNYNLMLCSTDRDPSREVRDIRMMVSSRVDGLIVAPEQSGDSPEALETLVRQQTPLVLVNSRYPGLDLPWVGTDDADLGRIATEHLIDMGHRHIAHIRGKRVSAGDLRNEGFVAAMNAHGLAVRPEWVVDGEFSVQGGKVAMRRLAAMNPTPTAVFCANDSSAMGAIGICHELGIEVPRDLSIVGAGNVETRHHPFPFLTTIDWPKQELGNVAGQMLLQLIEGSAPLDKREVSFEARLLSRRSVRDLRSTSVV